MAPAPVLSSSDGSRLKKVPNLKALRLFEKQDLKEFTYCRYRGGWHKTCDLLKADLRPGGDRKSSKAKAKARNYKAFSKSKAKAAVQMVKDAARATVRATIKDSTVRKRPSGTNPPRAPDPMKASADQKRKRADIIDEDVVEVCAEVAKATGIQVRELQYFPAYLINRPQEGTSNDSFPTQTWGLG